MPEAIEIQLKKGALELCVLALLSQHMPLHALWLAKPAVEALVAAIGFIVWRQWVFR